ncbi:MAG: LamG-like jellyroll fold domain-containing protein, partial [Planctomycetota bacterium]
TSGEATKLYINGVLDTPSSTDDVIGGTTIGYTDVIVGRGGKDANGSWDGLVDDFRVYEVALTAQQVQTVMNGGDIPVVDVYVPLTSVANIYDEEPINSKQVNEKDRAILDEEWLQQLVWPEW